MTGLFRRYLLTRDLRMLKLQVSGKRLRWTCVAWSLYVLCSVCDYVYILKKCHKNSYIIYLKTNVVYTNQANKNRIKRKEMVEMVTQKKIYK